MLIVAPHAAPLHFGPACERSQPAAVRLRRRTDCAGAYPCVPRSRDARSGHGHRRGYQRCHRCHCPSPLPPPPRASAERRLQHARIRLMRSFNIPFMYPSRSLVSPTQRETTGSHRHLLTSFLSLDGRRRSASSRARPPVLALPLVHAQQLPC